MYMHKYWKFLSTPLGNFCLKLWVKDMTDWIARYKDKLSKEKNLFCIYSCPTSHIFFDIPRKKPQNNFQLTFVLSDIFDTTLEHITDLFFQIIRKYIEWNGL